MLAPTPLLRPSPLDVGGVFTATFDILKRRFGTFVGLSTLSMILPIFVLIGGGLFALVSLGTAAQLRMLTPTSIAGAVVLLVTALIGIALAQLKVQGMLAIGAYEVAQGGRPDAAGLWTRSHGFLRRIIPTMLVIGLIFAGAYLVLGLIIVGILTASSSSGSRSSGPAIMAVLVVVVAVIAFLVVVFVASVKLLYLVSSAALEGTSGTATLKRSWSLTSGAFWRTFGYYFLGSMVASFASLPISFASQFMLAPLQSSTRSPSQADMVAIIPFLLLVYGLQFATQILVLPFITTFVTVMFIDQVRRNERPSEPDWVPGQPLGFYGQGRASQPPQGQTWTPQPPQGQGWTAQPPYGPQNQGQTPWPPQSNWPPQTDWPNQGGYPPPPR